MIGGDADALQFKKGVGCPHCNNTGYSGRIGIYELLEMDMNLADFLRREDTEGFNHAALNQKGYTPLVMQALNFASSGLTTMEEVFRIAGEIIGEVKHPVLPGAGDEPAPGGSITG
jgi:MSHA biogenesis protein MshE